MVSARRTLVIFTILIAGAESNMTSIMVGGVIAAIQRRYLSGCVYLLHTSDNEDLTPQEGFMLLSLRKHLSEERVQVAARRLQSFNDSTVTLKCTHNTPLNVVLSSDLKVKTSLLEFSNKIGLAGATWLLFLTVGNVNTFFTDVNVPFNCEFLVARPSQQSFSLTEVYRVADGMNLNEFYFGRWTSVSGLSSTLASIYRRRSDLQGIVINAVAGDDPPILTLIGNQTQVSGFFGRVWSTLEKKMNFKTNYTITTDLTKGKPMDKNDCSGMIGMLQCGEVDVALGSFSTSSYPTAAVKFSMPLLYTTNQIFIKKPAGRNADWDAFLMPFSSRLWFVLLATILFISLYLTTFYSIGRRVGNEEAEGPELYTLYDSILYIFGAFCQQGHDVTPRSTSCRLVYITAYLTALVLLAAYSAALISSLTVYRSNLPFSDLDGIVKDNTYKVGVVDKSEMFYTVSDQDDNEIFEKVYPNLMASDAENFPPTTLDGLRRVCAMKYAFIAIPESVMPLINKVNCSIVPLPYKMYPISLSIAFSGNVPYIDFFSYRLRMLRDGGVIHRLRVNNWPYLGHTATKSNIVSVDLKAVAPLLVLLASSVVVSVAVLILERGKFALSKRNIEHPYDSKKNVSRRDRNAFRQNSTYKDASKKENALYLSHWRLLSHKSLSTLRGWND